MKTYVRISEERFRGNQNTFYVQKYFFPENRNIYEIMWAKMVETDRLQVTVQYGARCLHAAQIMLQTHIHNI